MFRCSECVNFKWNVKGKCLIYVFEYGLLQGLKRYAFFRKHITMKLTDTYIFLFYITTLGLTSCDFMNYKSKPQDQSDLNVNKWNETKNPHLKPMYGNLERTAKERLNDKEFIDGMLFDYKDKTTASKKLAKRGWYYFYHNVIDTAMFRFNQCWLMDSTYAESYFGFAAIKEYQGLNDLSEKFYQLAYKHDNSDTLSENILNKIAYIKEQQKDTVALITAYKRAFTKFPNNEVASGKLGFFYSTIHQQDSALIYYNLTIELDPEYEQTYLNRAWLFYQQRKYKQAIADYTTVIKKNKQSIFAYANRANAFMNEKQYQLAIADINQCIALDSTHPNFHFAKAECFHQLGQNKNACEEIKTGIKKGGKYTEKLKEYKCE